MHYPRQRFTTGHGRTTGFGKFKSVEEAHEFVSKRGEVKRARKFVKESK